MLIHEWLVALAPGDIAVLVAGTIAPAGAGGWGARAFVGICEPTGWMSSLVLDCAGTASAARNVPGITVTGVWAGTGSAVAGACIDPA